MADTKISALSAGTAAPGDEIPVNRSGSNFKITAGDILKINGGTITADSPVLNLTQTWNNAAVTFTGLKFNVPTDSSASGSLLMDLQVGGTSQANVTKAGVIRASGIAAVTGSTMSLGFNTAFTGASNLFFDFNVNTGSTTLAGNPRATMGNGFSVSSAYSYNFSSTASSTGTADIILTRDAAGTLAQRNAANAQTFRLYNTYTDATNTFERGKIAWESDVLRIGTEKGVTGGLARALELQTDGVTRLTIAATGAFTFATTATFAGGRGLLRTGLLDSANFGIIGATGTRSIELFTDDTSGRGIIIATGSGNVQFGGTTSSFPALKRSSATLIARLADDSANAAFESASLKTDAPTGGTAATWKLGTVASVTPTSPDRTIEVDIGGTIYYLHAKTTND